MVSNAACPDFHAYFLGQWRFTRVMQGIDASPIGHAEGIARFAAQANSSGLHYHESGQLHLSAAAHALSFSRRFDYQLSQPGLVQVSFADGPQQGQSYQHYRYDAQRHALLPVQTHVCLRDRYEGWYQFIDAAHFDLHTRIEGPHKAYVLRTHFTRAAVD